MNDLKAAIEATGGPFFEVHWRVSRVWHAEKYRLFRHAKERCLEETRAGAELAYVRHILTDEAVFSDSQVNEEAYLGHVHELEAEVQRLKPFEAALRSMAEQFLCPKTTAEELASQILKGEENV